MKQVPAHSPSTPHPSVSWVETDRAALEANCRAFRRRLEDDARLIAVVKADAYGHGADIAVPAFRAGGADGFAVVTLDEGLTLRRACEPELPIWVLGRIRKSALAQAREAGLEPTIYDAGSARAIVETSSAARTPVRVHLKLETGTNRQGVRTEELGDLIRILKGANAVEIAGVSTHFADIEDTTDHAFADEQLRRFDEMVRSAPWPGGQAPPRHAACSAAAILFPKTHLDFARIGIGLYGLWPSRETLVSAQERQIGDFALQPAMALKTIVAQIKSVPAGDYIGYGRTFRATRAMRIAVLPLGYYDGYPRALGDRAHVLVAGQRARVVGRICMNMMMVDVTDVPDVATEDPVTLLGRDGGEQIRAEELAAWASTIHYEIVSRIHPGLPRVPVDHH